MKPLLNSGQPVPAQPQQEIPVETGAETIRLSRIMAERGLCSRREADAWIGHGWVFVDGVQISALGTRILPNAKITLAPEAHDNQSRLATVLIHKPVGYVSSQPESGCKPAILLVKPERQFRQEGDIPFFPACLKGLAPAGRLDVDSAGLLVLTQDGRVARQLIGEDSTVEKEYLVRVTGQMDSNGLKLLHHGLSLDGRKLKPADVHWLNSDQLRFVLREGRKRQIRRMCELVGLHVIGLKRVRIGKIRLGNLAAGQWRYLGADEHF